MAQAQKGLGRGLEALLGGYRDERAAQDVLSVALNAIRANAEQPRRTFSQESLQELAASIREQGLLQPVLVRPIAGSGPVAYEIVAGERRWRAAALAGLTTIPVLVREVDDEQSLALALIENLQREDLNPMEQASGLGLLQSRFGMTQEELAKKVGMSRPAVANTLRLLQLPAAVQADLAAGTLTPGHARALLSLADETLRQALWQRIVEANLSVRQAEECAAYARDHGQLPKADRGAENGAATPKRRSQRAAVDAGLRSIEDGLSRQCGMLVKTSGTVDHGRVTFQFSSRRELEVLLERLGVSLSDIEAE